MLTETDWKEEARAIKAGDPSLTCPQIAERVGRTPSAVWKALHPERTRELNRRQNEKRHEIKLAWQRDFDRSAAGRGVCGTCGGPMGIGALHDGRQTCAGCLHAGRVARARQIEELWREGVPGKEIAERLGWSEGTFHREANWMRRNGFDLPYRYQAWAAKFGVPANSRNQGRA